MVKALSPLVSGIIIVVLSISMASMVAPWMYELVFTTTNETGSTTAQQVKCRSAGIDFDSEYGNYGVDWNFTGNGTDWLKAKMINTGTIDLYGFSFELTVISPSSQKILHFDATPSTGKTASDPLKAPRSAIIEANITEDINGSVYSLMQVRVLNAVCVGLAATLDV
ncbi:MAG: hypothetical protein JXC85_04020 [Candidatus Aenigmarchaeota archaeon]|nr:hypothetical protein [Candidatus Aenigmarchaeota archaeon]